MNTDTQTPPREAETSFASLCRFSDLTGYGFGYGGGARDACALIQANRDLLTFDACGNLTGTTDRDTLRTRVGEAIRNRDGITPATTPALVGHVYAFRQFSRGWFGAGLVENTPEKRAWWAHYWRTNATGQGEFAGGETAQAVAFMPYCVKGSNFVTQTQVDRDAVAVL